MTAIVVLTGIGVHADPWHALGATSEAIAGVLAAVGAVRVITTADPIGEADLLVVNASGDLAEPETDSSALVDAILGHADAGRPVLATHSSTLAFRDDARWAQLLGGRWVPGVSMHPQIGHALVQSTGTALLEDDFVLYDERYSHLESRDVELVAEHTEDGVVHPLVWLRSGRSRIAYDALGHGVESYDSAEHRALLLRLARWALG